MTRPNAQASELAELYRLNLDERQVRGTAGERLGKGTGSSLEFQERRMYVAGDDVRHLDWRAYARSDQLMVRLYREEISPRVDIVLDDSRSMATEPEKAQRHVDLARCLSELAARGGYDVKLVRVGDRSLRMTREQLEREGLELDGRRDLMQSMGELGSELRSGAQRLVISDFLFPADPRELVRNLARGGGRIAFVQVLGRQDREPVAGEALRLTDSESGEILELVLDAAAVRGYLERLDRHQSALQEETRRHSGLFCSANAEGPLEALCRGPLCRSGLLRPA